MLMLLFNVRRLSAVVLNPFGFRPKRVSQNLYKIVIIVIVNSVGDKFYYNSPFLSYLHSFVIIIKGIKLSI